MLIGGTYAHLFLIISYHLDTFQFDPMFEAKLCESVRVCVLSLAVQNLISETRIKKVTGRGLFRMGGGGRSLRVTNPIIKHAAVRIG